MSADCRTTTLGRHINQHIGRVSAEISADISVDMSVNMSTDTSRLIYRPSVGRHIDRHIGRASVDMSTDTRSMGAQNTHDPNSDSSHKTKAQGKNASFWHGQSTGQSEWSKLLELFSFLGDNDVIILVCY